MPFGNRREALLDVLVVGQRERAVSRLAFVALDVRTDLPLRGVFIERARERDGEAPLGHIQLHRPPSLPDRRRPGLHVGRVRVGDAVELDVVDAPGGELADDRVDVGPGRA